MRNPNKRRTRYELTETALVSVVPHFAVEIRSPSVEGTRHPAVACVNVASIMAEQWRWAERRVDLKLRGSVVGLCCDPKSTRFYGGPP